MPVMFDISVYQALFKDFVRWDPELDPFLALDLQRIERIVASRGISFVMIDMPEACKVLDQALASRRFWPELLPESFGSIRKGHRKLYRCLFTKIFDDEGLMRDSFDILAIQHLRTALMLLKKARLQCSDEAVLAEVEEFRKIDSSLYPPTLSWDEDELRFPEVEATTTDNLRLTPDLVSYKDQVNKGQLVLVQKVADMVISHFPDLDWRSIRPRHGKGAVADLKTGNDKFSFPTWPAKLEGTFPLTYFAQPREDLQVDEVNVLGSRRELPARLMAVPKTFKGPRMIASEPASHQFIQLGLMNWIRENIPYLVSSSIDFKRQDRSRDLCLEASKVGDLATVDLSAASDRLSCWVVERIFRRNSSLLIALHSCRTRWLTNAATNGKTPIGERYNIKLMKYAPMGNGTTFPVQSLVYAIMSIASVLYEEKTKVTLDSVLSASRRIRVYGDDIILPSSATQTLYPLLEHFQLKVNRRKSFAEGLFRESCGIDAYCGVEVTPLYLRALDIETTNADSLSSWVDVCKNATKRGYVFLSCWMEDRIPAKLRELIPRSQKDLPCLTLWNYFDGVSGGQRRFSRKLQRHEILALTSKAKVDVRKRNSYSDLLQFFMEYRKEEFNPLSEQPKWEAGYLVRARTHLRVRWVTLD